MPRAAPWILRSRVTDDVLSDLYGDDTDVFPSPLIVEKLRDWIDAWPELSICFRARSVYGRGTVPVGVVIVLPILKPHWDSLLVGKLKEPDITTDMFPREDMEEPQVGLHVFHIERSEAFREVSKLNHFAEFALEEVSIRASRRDWKILGFSALTATAAGKHGFARMGFRPTGYKEIMTARPVQRPTSQESGRKSKVSWSDGLSGDEGDKDQEEEGEEEIEIFCVHPGDKEPDVVAEEGLQIVSPTTEMVVRYPESPTLGTEFPLERGYFDLDP
jgi:hypothetical protein